ncbi:MAG TPA: KH domain-containing protein [Acidimicrobiales bacterium]
MSDGTDRAGAVLTYIAESIVDEPENVEVDVDGNTLRLHVAPDDMGKVIGRRGRVAQAIRTVVRAAGAKDGTDVNVDIVD